MNTKPREGVPEPGYSDRIDNFEILSKVAHGRGLGCMATVGAVVFVFVVPSICARVFGWMEIGMAVRLGFLLAVALGACALFVKLHSSSLHPYEAVVIAKRQRKTMRMDIGDDGKRCPVEQIEYVTIVKTMAGVKKRIVETNESEPFAWEYLNVGDSFRFHPRFHFPYELFDKSSAPWIRCVDCLEKNPVAADRCRRCNLPLLK